MKLKSTLAGLIISISMVAAVGVSQAGSCTTQCPVQEGFSGIGWHMVPCKGNTLQTASTWQQYVSGRYAPPVVRERSVLLWPL